MSDTNQKIGHLLSGQIPDYVQEYYPMFVIFMTKYFEFLETSSTSAQYAIQNIRLNRDIDTTADNLAIQFLNTYVPGLPNDAALDRSILVKYFRDFYQRKGSEESFKFFFRAFFNDDIEIVYPRDQMFATSAGDYYKETGIRVQRNIGDPVNLKHTKIFGSSSGAYAVVDRVVQVVGVGGDNVYDLVFQPLSWVGLLTSGETVTGTYYDYDNNTSGFVSTTSISGINIAAGRYLDSRSQLSNDQLLQDSVYYQQFSYIIRSKQDREAWANYILDELHPTGTIMFNEWHNDQIASIDTTSFVRTNQVETTVKVPIVKQYLSQPTFTFDRTSDVYTGTSFTQLATTTGFAAVAYTSIGDITYNATFDYPGENVTWGLQKSGDTSAVTEITRFNGPTFDKLLRSVTQDSQIINWPWDTNSSVVNTRYTAVSSALTAGTALTSFSSVLQLNTTSMILLVTWMKNTTGNNAKGESANAVVITFSSNVTVIPYFDSEEQRRDQRIALGRSLEYNKLLYVTSSNSITNNPVVTSGLPLSSTVTTSNIVFKPFNWERGGTYDRVAIRFTIDKQQQLNTSLTETFSTANITASGLIASWSSLSTSASISYLGTNSSLTYAQFASPAFVFDGAVGQTRFVQTTSLMLTEQLIVSVRYLVGDGYNGGDAPELGEDLELQYSINNGASWFSAAKLWFATDVWTGGQQTLSGGVWTTPGSNYLTGNGTLFATDLLVGDRITINSSTTTAYTITSIISNNLLTLSPALVDSYRNTSSGIGTVAITAGSGKVTGTATNFLSYQIGDNFSFGSGSTTAYTVTNIVSNTEIDVVPVAVTTTSAQVLYVINGVTAYKKLRAADQFRTTSLTVYGPGASVSAIVRVIQLGSGSTGINQDTYAIDDLSITSFRTQPTTGTVSIGVAVSSNSTLNINDTDFFNITTIGA